MRENPDGFTRGWYYIVIALNFMILLVHPVASFHNPCAAVNGKQWMGSSAHASLALLRPGACKLSMSASSFDQITEMADDADGICHHALNRHDEPMLRFGQLEQSNRRKAMGTVSGLFLSVLAPQGARAGEVKVEQQIKDGLDKICKLYPSSLPASVLVVAIIDDKSQVMKRAKAGIEAGGAKTVLLTGSVAQIQEAYTQEECNVVVVADVDALKKVNAGEGLQCKNCGFGGGQRPPFWFIVMDGKGKSDAEVALDANLSGRECSEEGFCFQTGSAIPTYSFGNLPSLVSPAKDY